MSTPYLDYSQYSLFNYCRWAWWERECQRRVRAWDTSRQSDSALTIGSLVHAGLENWYKHGIPEIPQEAHDKYNPTPEARALADRCVVGYVGTYPREAWELIQCEAPLRFPLIEEQEFNRDAGDEYSGYQVPCDGLAKLDMYFYIPEDMTIETGIEGYPTTLSRGWWIQEYKTKSQSKDRPQWIKTWANNLQASFQMMALQEHLKHWAQQMSDDEMLAVMGQRCDTTEVQGCLVNVIERPQIYIPRRKCKGCKETLPFAAYLPLPTGQYACPACGHAQPLEALRDSSPKALSFFRLIVTRTPEQLATHRKEMELVAREMMQMRAQGPDGHAPNRTQCVDGKWERECQYFGPHTYGHSTLDDSDYCEPEDYVNESETSSD